MFNRTDLRIYEELFPGRELKAQKLFELNTTANTLVRSPSFTAKGGQRGASDPHNLTILSNQRLSSGTRQRQRSASQKRGSGTS